MEAKHPVVYSWIVHLLYLTLTSPATNTRSCLRFPTMLISWFLNFLCREHFLSVIEDDALAPVNLSPLCDTYVVLSPLYEFKSLCGITHARIVSPDLYIRLLVMCCLNFLLLLCLAFSWFNAMSSRVDWNRGTYTWQNLCTRALSCLLACYFVVYLDPSLTKDCCYCMQHTRILTCVQHTKYYLLAEYEIYGSLSAVYKSILACSPFRVSLVLWLNHSTKIEEHMRVHCTRVSS